jgi:hypothetical protein
MTTGRIFSPWGVHPNIDHRFRCTGNGSRREFQQEFLEFETGFFLNGLHMIAYDGNDFFLWEPTLTLEDEILKKCVGFCHKRVFNTIWPTWHMGYSADQAKSVKKSTLILILDFFPLPPRTIASVRRVCFLLGFASHT